MSQHIHITFRSLLILIALLMQLTLPPTVLAQGTPGLPTRSQNPLLQSYFIPATPVTSEEPLTFSHALYITNTYQVESQAGENLVIDVENTRYDFQMTFRQSRWHFNVTIPLISNRSGSLDQMIEGWHDIFGLPQGGRDNALNNQINLLYQQNGNDIINSQAPSEGIGDIQLAAGYQLTADSQVWLAMEVPSSENALFISNQALDFALWYSRTQQLHPDFVTYGTFGLSLPANDGIFVNRLENEILFGQLGLAYAWNADYHLLLQLDAHSRMVNDSALEALGNSFQAQFGLRLNGLIKQHQLDLFFSEDIIPGYAPDITFGIRLSPLIF